MRNGRDVSCCGCFGENYGATTRGFLIQAETHNPIAGARARGHMKIDHLGIATANIENALSFWRDVLGLEASGSEEVPDQGVRVAMMPIGETRIELLEPLHENSPVGRFLEKRGPGFHHLAISVADIQAQLGKLREKGVRLIDEVPRVGAGGCLIAFVHPSATGGVLLELVERR